MSTINDSLLSSQASAISSQTSAVSSQGAFSEEKMKRLEINIIDNLQEINYLAGEFNSMMKNVKKEVLITEKLLKVLKEREDSTRPSA